MILINSKIDCSPADTNKKIVFVIANALDQDYRTPKEVRALESVGYDVTILSWQREKAKDQLSIISDNMNFNEIRINLEAPSGKGVLFYLPVWWIIEFKWLMKLDYNLIHVINFHSIIPALFVGKLTKKKVVYEIMDAYEDSIKIPNLVRKILIYIDRIFMSLASAVIIVDDGQNEEFNGIPNKKVAIIYDPPMDYMKVNIKKNKSVFSLFYAGVLNKARKLNLDKVIESIQTIDNVILFIAGYGDQIEEIKYWCKIMPEKVHYLGKISSDRAYYESMSANILFELRDPSINQHKYICGSKFLRAMSCEKPILVSAGTSAANIVKNANCGIVVDPTKIDEISKAILLLKNNPDKYAEMSKNSKHAFETQFSWKIMETRLLSLYASLFNRS